MTDKIRKQIEAAAIQFDAPYTEDYRADVRNIFTAGAEFGYLLAASLPSVSALVFLQGQNAELSARVQEIEDENAKLAKDWEVSQMNWSKERQELERSEKVADDMARALDNAIEWDDAACNPELSKALTNYRKLVGPKEAKK